MPSTADKTTESVIAKIRARWERISDGDAAADECLRHAERDVQTLLATIRALERAVTQGAREQRRLEKELTQAQIDRRHR